MLNVRFHLANGNGTFIDTTLNRFSIALIVFLTFASSNTRESLSVASHEMSTGWNDRYLIGNNYYTNTRLGDVKSIS